MLVVSVMAWLALLLAEVGLFRLAPILIIIVGGGLSLLVYVGRAGLAAAAGVLLCAVLLLPPYETAVEAGDATVYLNFGRQIARHGALVFDDSLLRSLSPDSRAALFRNRVPADTTGEFARFPGGFLIPDPAEPTVTAGFSPLFPVLTAVGHALGPPQLALLVAPFFAILSLIGLWCVARSLGGVHAAWITVALTAVSLPQIWFARLSVPETVAQCFVMAGVLAWLVASAKRAKEWALAAGWFLGLACFAKVDLLVFVPVFLLAFGAARLLIHARPRTPPLLLAVCASFGLLLVHNLAHYAFFASHYRPYVEHLIQASAVLSLLRASTLLQAAAVVAAGLLGATGVAAFRRPAWQWPRRLLGLAAVGVLVAYGVNYVMTATNRLDETIRWLSWYVSWPVLVLAAIGLLGLGLTKRVDSPHPELRFVGLLLGVVGLHYLYNPLEPGLQIDSMRRYVPVVLPFTMLFGALAAVTLLARVATKYRLAVTLATAALLVGLVARPSVAVVGQPLWDDALAQTAQVAQQFPPRAVVLVGTDLAGSHIQTSLSYLHDVDALLLQASTPDGEAQMLPRVISDWLAHNRPVFVLVRDGQHAPVFAPFLTVRAAGSAHIDLRLLERVPRRVPQATVPATISLQVFRITRGLGRARTPADY